MFDKNPFNMIKYGFYTITKELKYQISNSPRVKVEMSETQFLQELVVSKAL